MIRTLIFTTLTMMVGSRMTEYIPQLNNTEYLGENVLETSNIPNEQG